jgi:hypothetical protein
LGNNAQINQPASECWHLRSNKPFAIRITQKCMFYHPGLQALNRLHSSNVQAGCENYVALYCIRSSFHLLVQGRISHDSCSIFKFSASFIQSDDSPGYQTFRNIRQLTDVRKWSALPQWRMDETNYKIKATARFNNVYEESKPLPTRKLLQQDQT